MPVQSTLPTPVEPVKQVPCADEFELSLVAPVYNEADNLGPLYRRVCEVFGDAMRWELVLVDDGSADGSTDLMKELRRADPRVRCVFFSRNSGQTSAMRAGIKNARAPLVATLDADLQNDPADLPKMLELLGDADAIVGWRIKRNDDFVRRASSKIANAIRNRLSHDQIRDTGCSLKIFRTAAIRQVPLHFEGMHRFMPTLMRYLGFKVLEHPVSHHPRRAGVSKYGVANRALRALRDLFAVRWMRTRIRRLPIVVEESDVRRG
ncbi:MAG: glycosyltransferase family 2 protein [Planctomycetes bacterium]|nr:glycosyltransferase family 2 protein [Planctomycetota bacterium]